MNNAVALALIVLILGFFALDWILWGGHAPLFFARKLADLFEWLAFWR